MDEMTISNLPHRPPMVMIAGGRDIADGEAEATAVTSEECLFFERELDGVPACVALEYMAQTMAFAVGARARRHGKEPRIGFVLGARRLVTAIPVFRRGTRYLIRVKCGYADDEFASFSCEITDPAGTVVSEANLTAFQPEDETMLERRIVNI